APDKEAAPIGRRFRFCPFCRPILGLAVARGDDHLRQTVRTNIERGPMSDGVEESAVNRALVVILAAVTLDSIGIGLIFPILPRLLEEVSHTSEVSVLMGVMLALYSA